MSAKSFICVLCGNYIRGSGKVCTSCMSRCYNSVEWHQASHEIRSLKRRINVLSKEIKQIRHTAIVAWIKRRREERE